MMQNFRPTGPSGWTGANLICADVALDNHTMGRGYGDTPFVTSGYRGGSLTPNVIRGKTIVGLVKNSGGYIPPTNNPNAVVLMVSGDSSLPFGAIRVPGMNGGAPLRVVDAQAYDDGVFSGVQYWQFWWFDVPGSITDGRVLFR